MTPAEEVRAARKALDMTQQQLGEALGFSSLRSNVTVCEIETGTRNPSEPALRLLRLFVAAGARSASKLG